MSYELPWKIPALPLTVELRPECNARAPWTPSLDGRSRARQMRTVAPSAVPESQLKTHCRKASSSTGEIPRRIPRTPGDYLAALHPPGGPPEPLVDPSPTWLPEAEPIAKQESPIQPAMYTAGGL